VRQDSVTHQSQRRHTNTVRSRRVLWKRKNPKVREGEYRSIRKRVDHSKDRCIQVPRKVIGLGLELGTGSRVAAVGIWKGTGQLV